MGHDAAFDKTWTWNDTILSDHESTTDIGVTAANSVFLSTVTALVNAGVTDLTGLDQTNPEISQVMQLAGRSDQAPVKLVKEYVFFIPRRVNGIKVENAGIRVDVHRSGTVASIEVSGAIVHSNRVGNVESPQSPGYSFTRQVAEPDLAALVQSNNPGSTIQALGLQYRQPHPPVGVVTPMQTYTASTNTMVDGHTVHGRMQYLYYALDGSSTDPVVWPTPNSGATGDPRP